jgi:hypothetical protein
VPLSPAKPGESEKSGCRIILPLERVTRFRRLARDRERLPETLKGLHFLVFGILMAQRIFQLIAFCL